MKLTRKQIERMNEAIKDHPADEFAIETRADGRIEFSAVEIIERTKTLSLMTPKKDRAKVVA
jgi:hypothetical protein